jgi:hypothetical protein
MAVTKIFFASGSKGKEVRANGKGGHLARGWYVSTNGQHVLGPAAYRDCLRHPHAGGAEIIHKSRVTI